MKIDQKQVQGGRASRVRGQFYTRITKNGVVIQKWPRKRQGPETPAQRYQQAEFAMAARYANNSDPVDYQAAIVLSEGTVMVPRDFLMACKYGTLIQFYYADGTPWTRYRDVTVNAQLVLDQVTDEVGALMWRSSVGWVQINPGSNGQVLAVKDGAPQFQDLLPPPSPFDAGAGTTSTPYWADSTIYLTTPMVGGSAVSTLALTANRIFFMPLVVPQNRTFTSIAISIPTGGNIAGSNARLGVFLQDPTSGGPGAVALDAGNVSTATAGLRSITINQALSRGSYWVAIWPSAAITVRAAQNTFALANCGFALGNASPLPCNFIIRNVAFGTPFVDESALGHTINTASQPIPLLGLR